MAPTRRQMMVSAAGAITLGALASRQSRADDNRGHVVLLGDSIFDNGYYVGDDPGVIEQLREQLPPGWKASLLAVDGNVTEDVVTQLLGLPEDATHLVVSVGGNDALQAESVLDEEVSVVGQALLALAAVRDRFARQYRAMLDAVVAVGLPAAVCTIYDPNFDDPQQQRGAVVALAVFNDIITRSAIRRGLPFVDLRVLFDSGDDYANPIEPSAVGGLKLARAIARMVATHDFDSGRTAVYGAAGA